MLEKMERLSFHFARLTEGVPDEVASWAQTFKIG
jgi:hypothetical protein